MAYAGLPLILLGLQRCLQTHNPLVAGSSPARPTKTKQSCVARIDSAPRWKAAWCCLQHLEHTTVTNSSRLTTLIIPSSICSGRRKGNPLLVGVRLPVSCGWNHSGFLQRIPVQETGRPSGTDLLAGRAQAGLHL